MNHPHFSHILRVRRKLYSDNVLVKNYHFMEQSTASLNITILTSLSRELIVNYPSYLHGVPLFHLYHTSFIKTILAVTLYLECLLSLGIGSKTVIKNKSILFINQRFQLWSSKSANFLKNQFISPMLQTFNLKFLHLNCFFQMHMHAHILLLGK